MTRKPTRKPARRREPTPKQEGEQILEAAAKAGTDYAHEQVGSPHFHDWVVDQMAEAEEMRKRDPSSVIPLETPADARKVARNMLQQLEWDTKRQMDQREILDLAGATGVFGAGSDDWVRDKYGITRKDVTDAFFEAFDEQLGSPSTRDWLTDLVLETNEQVRGGGVSEIPRGRHTTRAEDRDDEFTTIYLTDDSYGDLERRDQELRRRLGVDLGWGGNFVNVYSRNPDVIDAAARLIGAQNIVEIPDRPTNGRVDPRIRRPGRLAPRRR